MADMMPNLQNIEEVLGEHGFRVIIEAHQEGKINKQQAHELAKLLDRQVGTNFGIADGERNFVYNIISFKKIFSDWFTTMNSEDYSKDKAKLVHCLKNENLRLNAIAYQLETIAQAEGGTCSGYGPGWER